MSEDTPPTKVDRPDRINVDAEVVGQLTHIAETMTGMVDQLMSTQAGQTRDLDHFRDELRSLRDSIRVIAKVLHEGNGQSPLISRVAVLETQMARALDDVDDLIEREENRLDREEGNKKIDKKGKYTVAAALVSGVVALATAIVSLLAGG